MRASWRNSVPKNIHGRFDWTVSDKGMKIYEYNADTSSLLMECSYIQGKWCDMVSIKEGKDGGR
jgi:glutathionylspermidine amidase/synthetase